MYRAFKPQATRAIDRSVAQVSISTRKSGTAPRLASASAGTTLRAPARVVETKSSHSAASSTAGYQFSGMDKESRGTGGGRVIAEECDGGRYDREMFMRLRMDFEGRGS